MERQLEFLKFFKQISVHTDNECWLWLGNVGTQGYGRLRFENKQRLAHTVSYEYFHGKIPDGLVIRHTCDTPLCCNPFHLKSGTHSDNVADRVERDRGAKGSKNGRSKLTEKDALKIFFDRRKSQVVAKEYDVDSSAVRLIWAKISWKHITKDLERV